MHAAVETKAKIKGKPRSRQGTNPLKTKATLKAVLARLETAKTPRMQPQRKLFVLNTGKKGFLQN